MIMAEMDSLVDPNGVFADYCRVSRKTLCLQDFPLQDFVVFDVVPATVLHSGSRLLVVHEAAI